MSDFWTILSVVVGLACIFGARYLRDPRQIMPRRSSLRALAKQNRWSFDAISAHNHRTFYKQFYAFNEGHSQECENTVEGMIEIHGLPHHLKMGDYLYKKTDRDKRGADTTTHRFSYLCLHLPFLHVPDLFIRPETFVDKLGAAAGLDDIDFESAEFSRKFHVSSSNKRFAYDVITPEVMKYLLSTDRHDIEMRDGVICFTSGIRLWTAREFLTHVQWVKQFVSLWPAHVVRTYTEGAA